jgi:hypothetical protein
MEDKKLSVIVKARELSSAVFAILERAPKRYRHSLVERMHSASLDIVERIYEANEIFAGPGKDFAERIERRISCAVGALTRLRVLDTLLSTAREMQCVTARQREALAKLMLDVQRLLGAFIKSARKRSEGT